MPAKASVFRWLANPENQSFRDQYARAREVQAETMAEELLEIADDARNDWMEAHAGEDAGWRANGENVQRSRLRVDARKWLMSKMAPKKYSERTTVAGDPEAPLQVQEVVRRIVDVPPA